MTKYPKAYQAIAKTLQLEKRPLEFLEKILSSPDLKQQEITQIDTRIGASDYGPTIHKFGIECATKTDSTYENLKDFFEKSFSDYPLTNIEENNDHKIIEIKLHNQELDDIARNPQKYPSQYMDATYAQRAYVKVTVYSDQNNNFNRRQLWLSVKR